MLLAPLLCAAVFGMQDPLTKSVSLTAPGETLEKALATLSESSGGRFVVDGPIAKDIVVIRFQNASLAEAMKRIASATTAHWQLEKDGYHLSRNRDDLAPIRKVTREWIAALLGETSKLVVAAGPLTKERALAQIRKDADSAGAASSGGPVAEDAREERDRRERLSTSPETRLLVRILQGIDLNRVAELCTEGKAFVMGTDPTSLQVPLVIDPQIWPVYLAEHNAGINAQNEAYPPDPSSSIILGDGRRIPQVLLTEPPAKVILTIDPRDHMLLVYGSLFDRDGARVVQATLSLRPLSRHEPPAKPEDKEPLLDLTDEDRRMATCLFPDFSEGKPKPIPSVLMKKLARPEVYEPMSLLAADVLFAAAKHRGENLAADLPEMMCRSIGDGADDPGLTSFDVIDDLTGNGWTTCTEDGGWLVIKPLSPASATAQHYNRAALSSIIDTGLRNGRLTIGDFASYAFASGEEPDEVGPMIVETVLQQEDIPAAWNDWFLFKLYGSLTADQKARLSRGGKIPFSAITPQQTHWIIAALLQDGLHPAFGDLASEPTQFLASGLDPNGWIEMKTSVTPSITMAYVDAEGNDTRESADIEAIAMRLYLEKHPALRSEEEPLITHLIPSTETSIEFKFQLARDFSQTKALTDTITPSKSGYKPDDLPEPLRTQIADLFKKFDDQVKKGEFPPPSGNR